MKKKRQTSVIKRMYVGFALMVLLLVATVVMMLDGNKRIHSQLESVTSNVFPLVTLVNETSVKLLAADKIFKDVLTNQNVEYMQEHEEEFSKAHQEFSSVLELLTVFSRSNPALSQQLKALAAIEQRYFSESRRAMDNYQAQQIARVERQEATRRFQKLQMALWVGMKEHISSQGNLAVTLTAESYFAKLKQTQTITSDALASDDLELIGKAIKDNKRSVTRLNYAYDSLVAQLPSLEEAFEQPVAQFTSDIGRKGGVLEQHFQYVEATTRLYQNIAVLAKEVDRAMAILATFRAEAEQLMNAAISNADNSYEDSFTRASLAGAMVTFFAMALGWLLARNVRKPLFSVLNTLEALTDGDMTRRVSGNTFSEFNKLSNHINTLATNLQGILNQMNLASGNLAKVAMENQAATAASNSRLNIQRQQTASVAAAMTEMEQSVNDVADRAQRSMEKVRDVEVAAQTGMTVIASTSSTIHQLSKRLDESVVVVSTLQAVSCEIGSILDVIRNIADQTNLLALNAAIEAARAGEQGRGFAVVADEVRVLAKRTADSTAEIESMIQNLQHSAGLASSVMQACVSEMHKSLTQSSDASRAMEDIQVIIGAISEMSCLIAQAAEEQTTTTHSIARSLEDISHIADANFHAMEHVADGCAALDSLASEQNSLVKKFIV